MPRAYRLRVALLGLAVAAGHSCAAMGQQPWDWPQRQWDGPRLLWRGQQPEPDLPAVVAEPDVGRPPLVNPLDRATSTFGPDDSSLLKDDIYSGAGGEPVAAGLMCDQSATSSGPSYQLFGRHCGRGDPLSNESWLYRPFSVSWSMGYVEGSPPNWDWLAGKQQGFLGALRLGWDHDYHWGNEARLVFDNMNLESLQWDLDLLYYPWGDSRWRPYLMIGVGAAKIRFGRGFSQEYDITLSNQHAETVFALPLAVGVKYRVNDWMVLRAEVGDNILFAEGANLNLLVNLAVTAGFEIRFGGSRRSYWPWNPGRHYW